MNYIKQLSVALLALTLCLSAAGCGGSGDTSAQPAESIQTTENQTEPQTFTRTALVTLGGVPLISGQTTYQELLSAGWTPTMDYAEDTLTPGSVLAGMSMENESCPGIRFNYAVINCGDAETTVADSSLYSFNVQRTGSDSAAGTEIGLPCGLTMASSLDEVRAALGEETEETLNEYEAEHAQYKFVYKADGDDFVLYLYFSKSDTSKILSVDYECIY